MRTVKIVIFFLFLIVTGATIYFIPTFRQEATKLLSYSECDTPLKYKLGTIDQRFGLANQEIQNDITTATNIWDQAEGKQLFTYAPDADITVNFIYDQRQALDTNITQLNTSLKNRNTDLQQQVTAYKQQQAAFKQKLDNFNATVDKYNQEGGAPPDAYNQLTQQQKQLKAEAQQLNAEARQLNLATQDYNTGVSTLNQNIRQFNSDLAQKPEEGLYNSGDNSITIYFASNQQELLHTLAHEFGHALGMQHVGDPTAIMYPYTTDNLNVTTDDKSQLNYVCREQSSVIHYLQVFDFWVARQMQNFKQGMTK